MQNDAHKYGSRPRRQRLARHAGSLLTAKRPAVKRRRVLMAAGTSLAVAILVFVGIFGLHSGNPTPAFALQPTWESFKKINLAPPVRAAQPPATTIPEPVEAPKPAPKPAKPKPSTPAPAPAVPTTIAIKGDQACQNDTQAALKLLAEKAPTHYAVVTTYVGVIECVAQGSGMAASESPPRYMAGDATRNAGTLWYAGTIAHDAGHSKLYHDYLTVHPGQSVPSDLWTGQNAEAACLDAQLDALKQMNAPQATLDYIQNIINSQYWNIPYENRWW